MAQIIGNGNPVNPGLAAFFDAPLDLSAFPLIDRFELRADRITRSDVGGVQRISQISPVGTSRPLTAAAEANRPIYLPGGGHSGLLDAAQFVGSRPDGFALGPIATTTHSKLLILRPTLPVADNTNMHLLSTTNAGTGRNAWYLRRVSGALVLNGFIGDSTVNGAIAATPVPADVWSAIAMTVNTATRTVSVGCRSVDQDAWTWGTAVYPEAYPATVTDHTLGARSALSDLDGLTGMIEAGLVVAGDMRTDIELLTAIDAWAFGPTSIAGL